MRCLAEKVSMHVALWNVASPSGPLPSLSNYAPDAENGPAPRVICFTDFKSMGGKPRNYHEFVLT